MNVSSPPTGQHPRARNVTVVLGPTNTGKTHLAVERMIGHETGMIGLPLRLLARAVYDTVAARCGTPSVALLTGEEKIVPPEPRYYVCTVEAMPADVEVDFLAIDEVQLASDLQRGHIFTDRLLHRRGVTETMILGASTMRGLIADLLPGAHFVTRPRFSRLTYAGEKKLSRLPARSAIVCFSADAVYATAELIRRQRGGAAVVLGALSPRTRNAQVELYQSNDVDFLVATDAIGMGLNMDVDHIAFAGTRKFDGRMMRDLTPAEFAQIAGRAGRHMNDGTFGITGEAKRFSPDLIERLESHSFDPVKMLQWRNRVLDFTSFNALLDSLNRTPGIPGLTRAPDADDVQALDMLSRDPDITALASDEASVMLLWDVCQIPDYRNITGGDHAALVGRMYRYLASHDGRISPDWFARQVSFADKTDGDIDALSTRIAHIRTWTFVANKADWLADPVEWQQRTRAIEDKLSDALHERLTQRFIDRRTSVLMKRMREKETLMSTVASDGAVTVEGQFVGELKGFHFIADTSSEAAQNRALKAASNNAAATEIAARARAFSQLPDDALALEPDGGIAWDGARIARLAGSDDPLRPRLQLVADEQLTGPDRDLVEARLQAWLSAQLDLNLAPLLALARAEELEGLARGLAFRLVENFGVLVRDDVADEVKQLDQSARATLRRIGVRFGAFHIFVPVLLKPAATRWKLALWGVQMEQQGKLDMGALPEPPQQGLTSTPADKSVPDGFYQVAGFRVCGNRAVRVDMLERLADMIRPLVFWKPQGEDDVRPAGSVEGGGFFVVPDMMSLVGCSGEEFGAILRAVGFRLERRRVAPPAAAEAPASEAAEDTPTETPPPDATTDAATDAGAGTQQDAAAATTAADDAPEMLEIWWPKSRKSRNERRGRDAARGGDSDGRKPQGKRGPRRGKGQDRAGAGGKRGKASDRKSMTAAPKRRRVDADSPFAALQALRERMQDEEKADG